MPDEVIRQKLPCQLPQCYQPGKIKEGEPIFISRKMNGVHAIFLDGKLITRERNEITGCQHIIDDCWILSDALGGNPSSPWVIEGELIVATNDEEDEFLTFSQTAAMVKDKSLPIKPELMLYVFDAVSSDEYHNNNKVPTRLYKARKTALINAFFATQSEIENLRLVEFLYEGFDLDEIEKCLQLSNESGWEGIIINRNMPYSRSKNFGLMKYKNVHTVDLEIVGFKRGTGLFRKTLGSLVVRFGDTTVRVSTGLDFDLRDYIWTHQNEYKGRVVEVKYQAITTNAKGERKLQFPVFVCIRPLGKEVNEED